MDVLERIERFCEENPNAGATISLIGIILVFIIVGIIDSPYMD